MVLSGLEPQKVFEFFEILSSVPHGSGNTKAVSDLCVEFAKKRNLEYYQDDTNNVIIIKEATKGYENSEPIILQGHLDMVCAKDPSDPMDMAKEPIKLIVDGDWIHADGTSLGGDDMIAVAMALAAIDSDTLEHPRIEAVFTVDEETGMDGAFAIDLSPIKGRRMLNLDSEEEGVLTCGCAGGARVDCDIPVSRDPLGDGLFTRFSLMISGLKGGHSGCEIEKGRGNSNKLLARFIHTALKSFDVRLVEMAGGKFDNVITLESTAIVALPNSEAAAFAKFAEEFDKILKNEYSAADPGVSLTCAPSDSTAPSVTYTDTKRIIRALVMMPQGVQEMSMDIPGLVQTSLNMGIVKLESDNLHFSFSVRSSILTQKEMLIDRVLAVLEASGGHANVHGSYPGWQFAKVSPIRDIVSEVMEEVFGKKAEITATHGGLECGLFMEKLPGLDCVSFGPDLRDIHSVSERMNIPSVERMWRCVCEILRRAK